MIRKPIRARTTSPAALLLPYGVGPLVRAESRIVENANHGLPAG
jgi:hypothetical protein